MNRIQLSAAALAVLFALPATAADPLSNSYWEAAYLSTDIDASGDTVEGIHLTLNVGFSDYVGFVSEFDQRRPSGGREALGSAGFILHTRNPLWQPYLAATYEQLQVDDNSAPEADFNDEGWGAELGLRYALTNLELRGFYKHTDYGEVGTADLTSARYGILAALQLSPKWALSAQWRAVTFTADSGAGEVDADSTDYTVGFRRYFATDSDRRKRKGGLLAGGDDEAVAE